MYKHQKLIDLMTESLAGKKITEQLRGQDVRALELYHPDYFFSKRKTTGTLHARKAPPGVWNGFEIRLSGGLSKNLRLMEFVLWHEVAHTFQYGKGYFGTINSYLLDPITDFWPDEEDSERLCDRFAATYYRLNTDKSELHEIFEALIAKCSFPIPQ